MKGILFKEPMFNAVIAGQKTQTRRICQHQNSVARYKPGDIVYLKEPFYIIPETGRLVYRYSCFSTLPQKAWKNKLFMPASAARYFIKIKDVRVERLLDISEADAKAEGVQKGRFVGYGKIGMTSYKEGFLDLFFTINRDLKTYNPWVFVYEFELATSNQQLI